MTTISVLTPSLGYGRFIEDTIRSTLLQVGVTVEHVVKDGGSEDDTEERVRKFEGANVRWVSRPDAGQSEALNQALSVASSEWVAWLNADEFYLPGALGYLVREAERHEADVAFGDAIFVDGNGRFMRLLPQHPFSAKILRWYGTFIASCATVFKRDVLGESPWNVGLRRVMDWELYLRLAESGVRFVHVPYPAGAFRVHEAQVTAQPRTVHHADTRFLQEHYGIPFKGSRSAGHTLHSIRKAMAGAYLRQFRARSLRGAGMRWFDSPAEAGNAEFLLKLAYPGVARRRQ